jgi:hypothetical protein
VVSTGPDATGAAQGEGTKPAPIDNLTAAFDSTGNAIIDNMYQGMFDAYSKGSTKFAGNEDPILVAAKEDGKTFASPKEIQDYANQPDIKVRATEIAQGIRIKRMLTAGKTVEELQAQFPTIDVKKYAEAQEQKLPAAPAVKTAAQQDEDLLNNLFGDDGLPSTGSARRTNAQIEDDKKREQLGQRYGLTQRDGEGQRAFGQRIRAAIAFEKERETQPLSAVGELTSAGQELKEEQGYIPPQEQRDLYEETRQDYNTKLDDLHKKVQAEGILNSRQVPYMDALGKIRRGTLAEASATGNHMLLGIKELKV